MQQSNHKLKKKKKKMEFRWTLSLGHLNSTKLCLFSKFTHLFISAKTILSHAFKILGVIFPLFHYSEGITAWSYTGSAWSYNGFSWCDICVGWDATVNGSVGPWKQYWHFVMRRQCRYRQFDMYNLASHHVYGQHPRGNHIWSGTFLKWRIIKW